MKPTIKNYKIKIWKTRMKIIFKIIMISKNENKFVIENDITRLNIRLKKLKIPKIRKKNKQENLQKDQH